MPLNEPLAHENFLRTPLAATALLQSSCVTLHCTNYPRPLGFSLNGNQALWF